MLGLAACAHAPDRPEAIGGYMCRYAKGYSWVQLTRCPATIHKTIPISSPPPLSMILETREADWPVQQEVLAHDELCRLLSGPYVSVGLPYPQIESMKVEAKCAFSPAGPSAANGER